MTIAVQIPSALREYIGGARELQVTADSVSAALEFLRKEHVMLYRSVCDETGAIRPHVNLFVNDAFLHELGGLDTRLETGDVLTIMPSVSGG